MTTNALLPKLEVWYVKYLKIRSK